MAPSQRAVMEIRVIRDAIMLYKLQHAQLPETLVELTEPFNYLADVEKGKAPVDPWGRPYEYAIDEGTSDGFLLWSRGADEGDETDDIRSDALPRR